MHRAAIMVQFGTADYAMSLGVTGERGHPAMRAAERHLIATALKLGVELAEARVVARQLTETLRVLP